MPTEPTNGNTIGNLDSEIPFMDDPIPQGDDHIRAIKRALQGSFPVIGGTPVTLTAQQINAAYYHEDQIGMINAWTSTVELIPEGWYMCDGSLVTRPDESTFQTPDLRDQFIKAKANQDDIFDTGGQDEFIDITDPGHALTIDEIPSHTHEYEDFVSKKDRGEGGSRGMQDDWTTDKDTNNAGGGEVHMHTLSWDNRPDYYSLMLIIYVGSFAPVVETPEFSIGTIDAAVPVGTDLLPYGDDEMRELKACLKGSFPNFTDASVILTAEQINRGFYNQDYVGMTSMWYGSSAAVPEGYELCTATAAIAPNFDGRYIKHSDPGEDDIALSTGGATHYDMIVDGHVLTTTEVPAHTHSINSYQGHEDSDSDAAFTSSQMITDGPTMKTTGSRGGDQAHSHDFGNYSADPIFHEVYWIMFTGLGG